MFSVGAALTNERRERLEAHGVIAKAKAAERRRRDAARHLVARGGGAAAATGTAAAEAIAATAFAGLTQNLPSAVVPQPPARRVVHAKKTAKPAAAAAAIFSAAEQVSSDVSNQGTGIQPQQIPQVPPPADALRQILSVASTSAHSGQAVHTSHLQSLQDLFQSPSQPTSPIAPASNTQQRTRTRSPSASPLQASPRGLQRSSAGSSPIPWLSQAVRLPGFVTSTGQHNRKGFRRTALFQTEPTLPRSPTTGQMLHGGGAASMAQHISSGAARLAQTAANTHTLYLRLECQRGNQHHKLSRCQQHQKHIMMGRPRVGDK